jgi:hypothetical protein
MNMLSRKFSEGSQTQSSTDSHGSWELSVLLQLDFLMRTGSNDATSGSARGDGGSRSLTPSDVLNGTLKALLIGA